MYIFTALYYLVGNRTRLGSGFKPKYRSDQLQI
jgi:hypothetical protein